jgi:hypothetical protein
MFDRRAVQSPPPSSRGAAALSVLVLLFAFVLVALASLVGAAWSPRRRMPAPGAKAPAPAGASVASSSGLRAYRDPTTGAFTEPPAPTVSPQQATPRVARPALTEVGAPGGGTMVNLQGAFQSDVKATAGARGLNVSCATAGTAR